MYIIYTSLCLYLYCSTVAKHLVKKSSENVGSMQARIKAGGGEPVWLPPEHHLDMCKDIHTHMEKRNLQREQSSHLQGKISRDHCNRQVDKPPGPHSHLNKPTRRELLKVATGRIERERQSSLAILTPLFISLRLFILFIP